MARGLLETNTCLRVDTTACPAGANPSNGHGINVSGENTNITLGTAGTGVSFDTTTASNNARIITQGPDSHGIRLFADGNAATTNIGRITTYADSLISTTGAGAHGILIDNTIGATNTAPVALDLGGRIEVTGANAVGLQLSDANLALADVDGDTTNGGEIRITGGISTDGIAAAIRDSSNTSIRLLLNGAAITGDIDLGAGADRLEMTGSTTLRGDIAAGAGNDTLTLTGTTFIGLFVPVLGGAITEDINMGAGNDEITFNSTATSYIGDIDLDAGDDTLTLNANVDIDFTTGGIDLGTGGDTLNLNSFVLPAGALPSFGDDDDTLVLNGSASLGSSVPQTSGSAVITRQTINMGDGDDRVEFNSTEISYIEDIILGDGDDSLRLGVGLNLPTGRVLDGGSRPDELRGYDVNATWAVTGAATGNTYNPAGPGQTIAFTSFGLLTGGAMADTFNVSADHTGSLFGNGGADIFNLTGGTLSGGLVGRLGNDTFTLSGSGSAILQGNINGGAGDDELELTGAAAIGTANTSGSIDMGTGNDAVTLNSSATSYLFNFDLGAGDDSLVLNANLNLTAGATSPAGRTRIPSTAMRPMPPGRWPPQTRILRKMECY